MFKTMTAGLLALSLTFTSATSTQAQGLSEDDVGKLIFGILATAAIAHAVKENRNDRAERREVQRERERPQVERRQTRRDILRHDSQARRSADRSVLPRSCVRTFDDRFGSQTMLGRRCLERNFDRAAHLPNQCAVRVFTDRGPRNGYNPRCLRQMGYSISRH